MNRIVLTFAGCMAAIGLAACGTSQGPDEGLKEGEKVSAPKAPAEPVELFIYSNNNSSEEVFNSSYGNALREKFPQYTIRYIQSKAGTTMPEMVATKAQIDLFWTSIGNYETALFEHKLETDMTELIRKHGLDLQALEPTVIDAMKQISGGKLYGVPVSTNSLALFYNKDIFDKFGAPYPTDSMTWNEANELAKRVTRNADGKQYYGIASSRDHIIRMNPLSVPNVDMQTRKPTIETDPRWKLLFETVFITPAEDSGYRGAMAKLKALPAINQFAKEQNLAMLVYPNTLPTSVPNELKTMSWDIAPLPVFPDRPNVGAQSYPVYFGLTTQTKHPDEAMELLNYMISEEYQTMLSGKGVLPIRMTEKTRSRLGADTDFKDKNYPAMLAREFAPITPKIPELDTDVFRAYRDQAYSLAQGTTDINTAFRIAGELAQKVINEKSAQ